MKCHSVFAWTLSLVVAINAVSGDRHISSSSEGATRDFSDLLTNIPTESQAGDSILNNIASTITVTDQREQARTLQAQGPFAFYSVQYVLQADFCEGWEPKLELRCGEGGILAAYEVVEQVSNIAESAVSCISLGESVECSLPADLFSLTESGFPVTLGINFQCAGMDASQLVARVSAEGPSLTCDATGVQSIAGHFLNLAVFNSVTQVVDFEFQCLEGSLVEQNFCISGGLCLPDGSDTCSNILADVTANQIAPLDDVYVLFLPGPPTVSPTESPTEIPTEKPTGSPTEIPTVFIPTERTKSPVSESAETLLAPVGTHSSCNVCGGNRIISNPDALVFLPGTTESGTCFTVDCFGQEGRIDATTCSFIPLLLGPCGCVDPPPSPIPSEIPSEMPSEVPSGIPSGQPVRTKSPIPENDLEQIPPPGSFPPCNVCGEGRSMTNFDEMVIVIGVGTASCYTIDCLGMDGNLEGPICTFLGFVVAEPCGCVDDPTPFPSEIPSEMPSEIPSGEPSMTPPVRTKSPISAAQTALLSPVGTHPECNICGDNLVVGSPDAEVTFPGFGTGTCYTVSSFAMDGRITPTFCGFLPTLLAEPCGCIASLASDETSTRHLRR